MENLIFNVFWLPPSHHEPEEFSLTRANLTIQVGPYIATRHFNQWSQSIQNDIQVSLYPLACWLIDNWDQLIKESPASNEKLDSNWRMSHEVAAIGQGYLWPNLHIARVAEGIEISGRTLDSTCEKEIHYQVLIEVQVFVAAVNKLLQEISERLKGLGYGETVLGLSQQR